MKKLRTPEDYLKVIQCLYGKEMSEDEMKKAAEEMYHLSSTSLEEARARLERKSSEY